MNNFCVVKVLDSTGVVRPDTAVYGDVEIRPAKSDRKEELAAIIDSAGASRSKVSHEIASRICTIVRATSIDEALQTADERFVPVLDLLSIEFALGQFFATQCGYVKNLDSGNINPIKSSDYGPNTSFLVSRGPVQKYEFNQWILNQKTDLAERYKRSIHWTRNAKWEKSIQVSILYRWFAVEALFKQDVNDDVTSLILLFLGFPGGTYSKDISRSLLSKLSANDKYNKWKRPIRDAVDKIRVFRNDSVHSGFRSVDYPRSELSLYDRIMTLGAARCQGAAGMALTARLETVGDFKNYAGIIFESRNNIENDVVNNVIFSLENDFLGDIRRTHV